MLFYTLKRQPGDGAANAVDGPASVLPCAQKEKRACALADDCVDLDVDVDMGMDEEL